MVDEVFGQALDNNFRLTVIILETIKTFKIEPPKFKKNMSDAEKANISIDNLFAVVEFALSLIKCLRSKLGNNKKAPPDTFLLALTPAILDIFCESFNPLDLSYKHEKLVIDHKGKLIPGLFDYMEHNYSTSDFYFTQKIFLDSPSFLSSFDSIIVEVAEFIELAIDRTFSPHVKTVFFDMLSKTVHVAEYFYFLYEYTVHEESVYKRVAACAKYRAYSITSGNTIEKWEDLTKTVKAEIVVESLKGDREILEFSEKITITSKRQPELSMKFSL
jgi:hypothetical protein